MRAVIQRTFRSVLSVDGEVKGEIKSGLTVFLAVCRGDTEEQADYFARKLVRLRVFKVREEGVTVATGVFGAHMFIEQEQDGPLSFVFEC